MLKQLVVSGVVLALSASVAMGASQAVRMNIVDGDKEEAYNKLVNKDIDSIGFVLSDPHARINDAYKEKYSVKTIDGKKNDAYDPDFKVTLANLGFMSITNDAKLRTLILKDPRVGGFSPFNLLVYTPIDKKHTYVGHVDPDFMMDIVGIKDAAYRKEFRAMFDPLDKMVQDKIGGKVEYLGEMKLPKEALMEFTLEFERPDDVVDFIDEFQEGFEAAFEEHKFIIAGYKNFTETYEDMEEEFDRYDAYWVYSLCHFVFSYNVFNKGRPDAGVFAPCSMYMYIEKGKNVLHIGMPRVTVWETVLGIKDADKIKRINAIDKEMFDIMHELGAKDK